MNTKLILGMTALALVLSVGAANAEEGKTGFYTSLGMGAAFPEDSDLSANITTGHLSGKLAYDNDFAIAGAVGYHFLPWLRGEFEIGHTGFDVNKITLTGPGGTASSSVSSTSFDAMTYMANAYADWHNSTRFVPYAGFGLGVADLSIKTPATTSLQSDDSDVVFAWQAAVGTAYKITDSWSADLGWRYVQTSEGSFKTTISGIGSTPVKAGLAANEIRVGVRFDF